MARAQEVTQIRLLSYTSYRIRPLIMDLPNIDGGSNDILNEPADKRARIEESQAVSSDSVTVAAVIDEVKDIVVGDVEPVNSEYIPIDTPEIIPNKDSVKEKTRSYKGERHQHRVASGMAALLAQLRGGDEENVDEEEDDVSDEETQEPSEVASQSQEPVGESTTAEPTQPAESVQTVPETNSYDSLYPKFNLERIPSAPVFKETSIFASTSRKTFAPSIVGQNNYVKQCLFSPDGRYLASTSQDRVARIFSLAENKDELSLSCELGLGDIAYDAVWHPCGDLLATTAKHHPIHLWSPDGTRMASYRGINHLDELAYAYSMAFSADGLKLFAGYKKCIRIWDVKQPGRKFTEVKSFDKSVGVGLTGQISSIATNPLYPGSCAIGCYGRTVGLYSELSGGLECVFEGDEEMLAATHLRFSRDGVRLFCAGRKDNTIYCWDIRNPGETLFKMVRPFHSNHKVFFDLDRLERYLFTGTSDGDLAIFDMQSTKTMRSPAHTIKVATSAVPSVSVHPFKPLVSLCTGERVYPDPMSDSDEDEGASLVPQRKIDQNGVQLWRFNIQTPLQAEEME